MMKHLISMKDKFSNEKYKNYGREEEASVFYHKIGIYSMTDTNQKRTGV